MSNEAPAAAAAPAKKSSGKLIIIAVVAVVVLGGGGAGFWWWSRPAHAEGAAAEKKHEAAAEAGGIVPLEPFTVNLADGGSRFLRTSLKLVVSDEKAAEKISKNEVLLTRMRSAILELLTQQKADALVTAEGKTELKKSICEHLSPMTGGTEVTDVLFSDFVVQF